MKQSKHIFKVLGLFLSLFMLATVSVNSLVKEQNLVDIAAAQSTDDTEEPQAELSELSLDFVIPSFAFDFGSDFALLPSAEVSLLIFENTFQAVTKPVFRISYFEKLFEHHIAINAP
ncbi:hypothetical protein [Jiulongibacter sp. NS-SX5]|uniref:hypothetical protein n=1 Tax=Jiulongibacter sp. NS-SX5 TaxID=3463854 RepID=UPI004059C29F